jgi:hypothetical protein
MYRVSGNRATSLERGLLSAPSPALTVYPLLEVRRERDGVANATEMGRAIAHARLGLLPLRCRPKDVT